ncbi:MAG TPA: hypothetical protein PKE61_12090 [Burkholderiaceae bacterium]|nr:hypothetical protein [Burkholderiaceae bacterium]HMY98978.1 hypothetical protein [Burkholderiaceae bacterium]HNB43628.1 hypothetical protein [Burkholderiaceae bacterium]HNG80818.1 hypothetical protein [Burkholderiaceae bacterium]
MTPLQRAALREGQGDNLATPAAAATSAQGPGTAHLGGGLEISTWNLHVRGASLAISGKYAAADISPAVQPEVTQGTMKMNLENAGVMMEGKPVSPKPRAFARTEVAGLDDLPRGLHGGVVGHPEVVGERRGVFRERRGVDPSPSGFHSTHPPSLTAERLEREGERWLKSLPVTVRPVITAKRHPHIVNKLAKVWDRPAALSSYMDDLLISHRPGRRGFAMEVLEELMDLQRALQDRRRV